MFAVLPKINTTHGRRHPGSERVYDDSASALVRPFSALALGFPIPRSSLRASSHHPRYSSTTQMLPGEVPLT